MDIKPLVRRSLLATVGYLLSPFSAWNDLYVNLPIAYGLASLVGLIDRRWFSGALIASYWFTNVAGLIMLHRGLAPEMAGGLLAARLRRRRLVTDIAISLVYTGLIALFWRWGWIKLPWEYFAGTGG